MDRADLVDPADLIAFRPGCILIGCSESTANRKLDKGDPAFPRVIWVHGRRYFSVADIERTRAAEFERRKARAGLLTRGMHRADAYA